MALKDKVILVTGAASGIDQDIVKKLQTIEAIPIVFDKVKKVDATWKKGISDLSLPHWFTVDLVEEDPCCNAVCEIIDRFRASIEANLTHYFTMSHLCLDPIKKNKGEAWWAAEDIGDDYTQHQ